MTDRSLVAIASFTCGTSERSRSRGIGGERHGIANETTFGRAAMRTCHLRALRLGSGNPWISRSSGPKGPTSWPSGSQSDGSVVMGLESYSSSRRLATPLSVSRRADENAFSGAFSVHRSLYPSRLTKGALAPWPSALRGNGARPSRRPPARLRLYEIKLPGVWGNTCGGSNPPFGTTIRFPLCFQSLSPSASPIWSRNGHAEPERG